jgi:hypothetical protein
MITEDPRFLYKYRPIDKYASDIFCRGTLFFGTPEILNDPFEGEPVLDTGYTEQTWRHAIASDIRERRPHFNDAELQAAVQDAFDRHYPPSEHDLESFRHRYHERVKRLGIFSTSARWDSIVMWAHYAENHCGLCLELDTAALPPNIRAHQVIYAPTRPVINLFADRSTANLTSALTKNKEWRYEDEWRLVLEPPSPELSFPCEVECPKGFVSAAILGARITPEDRRRVLDWVTHVDPLPSVHQASVDERDYRVNRSPMGG